MSNSKKTGKRINPYKLFTGCWVPEWLAIRSEISQGAKLAYGRLCRYAGKDGKCNPRIKTLAYEIGVKKRQASEYLAELKDCKLIEAERNGRGKSNWYYFLSHNWMNSSDMQDTATQKGVDMQDSASLNMQDTATQKAFDMQDSASPYKESQYLRESEEEERPALVNGCLIPESLQAQKVVKAYETYLQYMKENWSRWPTSTTTQMDLHKLAELQDSGNDPVKVIEQTIQGRNKSFYPIRDFDKKDSDNDRKQPYYNELQ